jgi:hypothetical protein
MSKDEQDSVQHGIFGDIRPESAGSKDSHVGERGRAGERDLDPKHDEYGGSQHDRTEHSGSRDVTEGTTGGTGVEVGGTRNYRQGGGATGTDIGNRPE